VAAAVRIEAMAFADERIELLGDLAGYNRHEALGRLARLWSYCTDKETDIADEAIIRAHLGLRGVEALTGCGLGEQTPDGIRLRGGERLFWLRDKRENGRKGGQTRAAKAAAATSNTGAGEPQAVAKAEPRQTAASSSSEPQAKAQAIAKAKANPIVIALSSGTYVPEAEAHTNARARVDGPGPRFSAERADLGITIDEAAKALGLDADELAQLEAGDRQPSQAEAGELELLIRRARGEVHVGLDETRPVLRRERRDVAKALWAYQDKVRAQVVPDARPLKLQDMPGGQLDPIALILATWSPADCRHALDMAAEEARVLGAAGKDPLAFLNGRTNWKQEQFERLCQATPEQIRARAGPREKAPARAMPRGSSRMPASKAELEEAKRKLGGTL
jgi:transcriptional regulator with XRE-family HTH domain